MKGLQRGIGEREWSVMLGYKSQICLECQNQNDVASYERNMGRHHEVPKHIHISLTPAKSLGYEATYDFDAFVCEHNRKTSVLFY